jgi:oligopeptide transport system permease protein
MSTPRASYRFSPKNDAEPRLHPVIVFFLRRLLSAIPTLLAVITIAFFMMRLTPGGPFDNGRHVPPEVEANLLKAYNLDKPLPAQYWDYLSGVLHGDFGPSFQYKDFTVSELIRAGFPVSLRLGLSAMAIALVLGVTFGTLAALRQNRAGDHAVMGFAVAGIAIPNYVVAPVLTLVFGIYLGWLPVGGWSDGAVRNMILPVVTLALPLVAFVTRLTRGSMIEVLRANYIRTARAKGLPMHQIVWRHALPAAILPVVTYLGPGTAAVITGSLVVEEIFGLPGIGRYFVLGALNRDYTLVMGVVIFYAALIILLNLVVDLLHAMLDPKVRYR